MFTRKSICLLLAIVVVVLLTAIYLGPKNQKAVTYQMPLSVAVYPGLRGWQQLAIKGMPVFVLLPRNYTTRRKYPVLLFLHQQGGGDYPEELMEEVNPWFNSKAWRKSYPAIVVCPAPDARPDYTGTKINFGGFSAENSEGEDNAITAVKLVEGKYSADRSQVYVTGLSLGGVGAWDMLIKYNALTGTKDRIFAAGMPLAGSIYNGDDAVASPTQAVVEELRRVPIWAIHGGQDDTVPPDWDKAMAGALAKSSTFHLTVNPNLAHDVWDTYYPLPSGKAYWDWLFAQRVNRVKS